MILMLSDHDEANYSFMIKYDKMNDVMKFCHYTMDFTTVTVIHLSSKSCVHTLVPGIL
jgi:hypothetical protein